MPIYEYRCPDGHTFEAFQKISDEPVQRCEECGAEGVQRVFHPVAIHFKGSGFHNTDYGKRKRGSEAAEGAGANGDKAEGAKDKAKEPASGASGSNSGGSGSGGSKDGAGDKGKKAAASSKD